MPTQEERDRAMAVHSLDDQTRLHSGGDETGTVMDAGGEIQPPPDVPQAEPTSTSGDTDTDRDG